MVVEFGPVLYKLRYGMIDGSHVIQTYHDIDDALIAYNTVIRDRQVKVAELVTILHSYHVHELELAPTALLR